MYIKGDVCTFVPPYVYIIILAKPVGGFFSENWHNDRYHMCVSIGVVKLLPRGLQVPRKTN